MNHILINIEEYAVHIFCDDKDIPPSINQSMIDLSKQIICEASGNWKNLEGPYRCRVDQAHDAGTGQRHIHLYKRDNQFLAFNWDGSGRDGLSGRIPTKVFDALQCRFPDLGLPDDRVIESMNLTRMIKFSQFFVLRQQYEDAMERLNEAVELAKQVEGL